MYDILIAVCIDMYLGETYCILRTGKNLSDAFPIQIVLKQGDVRIVFVFQLFFRIFYQKVQRSQGIFITERNMFLVYDK
jgi:hypothetical protein